MTILDPNAIIAEEKLTSYLLIHLEKDDKSKFLAQGGYRLDNWWELEKDLREQILPLEAIATVLTQYGQKFAIVGSLVGPNGCTLHVKAIWIVNSGATRLVTLFPA